MVILSETINKAVRDIINTIINISDFAIKNKQNAPRPSGSYASVDVSSITKVGIEEQILTDRIEDLDIDDKREGFREIMISINFYRDNAFDYATLFQIGLTRNSILEFLSAAKLGLGRRSEVREISEALENGWEERAQMDFILHAVGTDEDIITSIQAVTISGDFQTRGKSVPVTIEV